jgi:hypothetical protein
MLKMERRSSAILIRSVGRNPAFTKLPRRSPLSSVITAVKVAQEPSTTEAYAARTEVPACSGPQESNQGPTCATEVVGLGRLDPFILYHACSHIFNVCLILICAIDANAHQDGVTAGSAMFPKISSDR